MDHISAIFSFLGGYILPYILILSLLVFIHELTHIRLETEARRAGRNRFFSTTAETHERAMRALAPDLRRLTQQGHTRDMVFDIPDLIEHFTSFMTLQPGDLILTGTPDGVVDCQPGDVIVTSIEGLGDLVNTITSSEPA